VQLLFKREQSASKVTKVSFKLWSKVELDEEEQALAQRYNLADALVLYVDQPGLKRNAAFIGAVVFVVASSIFNAALPLDFAIPLGLLAGGAAGYVFHDRTRETLLMKDLLHGRYFSCPSLEALARKEAWVEGRVTILRQVLESAKHWDGTERIPIDVLPKEEAKELMVLAA